MDEEPVSRAAGGCLLAAAGVGVGAAIYALSRDALVIVVWFIGFVLLYRAAKRVPHASNPAPPPLSESGSEAKPQVDIVQDPDHHNRWMVKIKKTGTS